MAPIRLDTSALVAFAQRLVQTESVSGHEDKVAALTAEVMRQIGFDQVRVDRMGNVIGRVGSGEGRKLLYDAHMDTVDAGEPDTWERPPYGGEMERGVLYGRGACDMKGALAAMLYAVEALMRSGTHLLGDLYVVAVVQEEPCEGYAIQHVVENEGVRPDWVLLGEATSLQVARGQRGRMMLRIAVHGRSAHSARPEKGVNAIYEAARAVVGLELMAASLPQDVFLGKGSVAVTEITSSTVSRNTVPSSCTFHADRRLTIGETEAKVVAEVRRALAREGVNATIEVCELHTVTYTGHQIIARQHYPAWVTAEDEALVVAAQDTIEDVLGFIPRLASWDFSTDGVFTAGTAGIPTIGFGPGDERYAHTTDEQIRVRDLEAAAQVYAELAVRLLGTE